MREFAGEVIADFAENLRQTTDQEDLRTLFADATSALGFKCYAYHMLKVVGVGTHLPLAVTTYPTEWVRRYIERDYVRIDPITEAGTKRVLPFTWDEVVDHKELDEARADFFSEADDFDLNNGLSIPIHGHAGEFAQLTLVADGDAGEAQSILSRYRHLAHLLAMYYHNHAGSMLIEQAHKNFRPSLTKREKEVLTWSAKGKTTWEISEILHIAESTVLYHIENAKQKLDVYNRMHAVVKAICMGLIDLS